MKTYKVFEKFSFIVAAPIRERVRVQEGEVIYDRDGEMKGYGRDKYEMVVMGHEKPHLVTAKIAYWGGDRYQPPHIQILEAEVKPCEGEPDFLESRVTSELIKTAASQLKVLDQAPEKEVEKSELEANLWNFHHEL